MAYAIFSPTACSHSGFDSVGTVGNMYNQSTTDAGCKIQVGGSSTGTINLTKLKQVAGFGGLAPETMPSYGIVNKLNVRIVGYTTAITDPTCTIEVLDGSTVLATASKNSWGSASADTRLDASVTIDVSQKKGYSWVENLTLRFKEKGNYSISTSKSVMYIEEIYLFVYWELPTYTVKFSNYGGELLQQLTVTHGDTPSYSGVTPTRASSSQYDYTFSGWYPSVGAISSDTEYIAQFSSKVREYTVIFENYDETVLQSTKVAYGSTPEYTGATPTKPQDEQYQYVFSEWSPPLSAVRGDAIYTALYTAYITVTTQVSPTEGGTVTAGEIIELGSPLSIVATPYEGYEFSHWLFNGVPVYISNPLEQHYFSENTVVTAVFKSTKMQSSVYSGTKSVPVYSGKKIISVYSGTKKLS